MGTAASSGLRRRVVQCAALSEWHEVFEAVDRQGCNINVQDEESGLSLVHWAANQGNEEALRSLIDRKAFLRLKDKRGEPPLTGAKGAAVNLLLQEAYSPVERVVYTRGLPDEARLQAELGDSLPDALNEPLWDEGGASLAEVLVGRHGANGLDAVPLLRWLVRHGADLEAVDEERNALLHKVDWSLGADIVVPLVTWALDEARVQHKSQRNQDGDTPALLCSYDSPSGADALRCLELFEKANANLSLGSAKGMNVAMALARYQGDGPWLSWCFTKAGVDPDAICGKARTTTDYLALHGKEESEEEQEE